jgi:hypothetical protein
LREEGREKREEGRGKREERPKETKKNRFST